MRISIVWLRQDLRLTDNPALYHAARRSEVVIPVYIHAPEEAAPWAPGAASNWWRHHSLVALQDSLRARGSRLLIRRGPSLATLRELIRTSGAGAVYWNHLYEPRLAQRDRQIAETLNQHGTETHAFHGALLYPPGSVMTKEQSPFRVFTPFWRACQKQGLGEPPLPMPAILGQCELPTEPIESLTLLPRIPWDQGLGAHWQPGERAALERLQRFCADRLQHYAQGRDFPGRADTSGLSPHLAFGEISPRQIVSAVFNTLTDNAEIFLSELGWREFAYHTLHHFLQVIDSPLNPRFEHFPWHNDEKILLAWQQGRTGIPLVDAGMHQLWQSGWMHNRVRMIVASFLSKNALLPWQAGARWFWDTLVDADLASNSFNWQWVAGCGLDAAPYFRIFNPVRQSERFDPDGEYLARWLPELSTLPPRWRHAPWLAPANVRIAIDYPAPILDLSRSRDLALSLYKQKAAAAKRQP